ncbi:MAG: tetratricopeptide repeat protein [Bacteroidetes bacterium]|nr:tetratricopeptide repeat protein [Bacteroidota bacterium]
MRWYGLLPILAVGLSFASCRGIKKTVPSANGVISEELKELYYSAENLYMIGNYKEAAEMFAKFAAKSPKPAAGFYRLACIELKSGNKTSAFENIQKAELADTSNYYYTLFEADLYKNTRQYSQAAKLYNRLAVKYPGHWSFYDDAAKMYKYAGEFENLILHCNQWEKAFSLREDIVQARTDARIALKKYDDAIADWQNLIRKYPYRKQYQLKLAGIYSNAGKPEESAKIYKQLLANDPENPELLFSLCQYFQEYGSKQELWQHCQIAVKSPHLDVWKKHNCLGPFLNKAPGNSYYDSLREPLITLTAIHSGDHRSWLFLADWYFSSANYSLASETYAKTIALFNNDFQVWSRYTESLDRTANYTSMRNAADSMLDLFPANPTVFYIAASAATGQQDWAAAKNYAETGLSFAVDDDAIIPLKLCMARYLNLSGKKEEALQLLQVLYEQYPNNSLVLAELAYTYSFHDEKKEACVNWVDQALQLQPLNFQLYYYQGYVYMKAGMLDKAIITMDKAVRSDPTGKIYELLGDIYILKNDNSKAREYWNLAWNSGYHKPQLQQKLNNFK